MSATTLLAASLAVPLAMLLACLSRRMRDRMPGLLAIAPLPALGAALYAREAAPFEIGAGPLHLTLALDGPGALLLGVAALLWLCAGIYVKRYLHGTPSQGPFAVCWLMTLAGCLGVFVAADMVTLYLLLAVQTFGACGLVIHDGTPRAWRSGSIYIGLALAGEGLLLMGFILLAAETPGDSLLIRDAAAALANSPRRDLILALVVGGFGLKAGLVPLHVWMPLAHAAAPVPASAVLSGAVVKVGIIGLIRFLPIETGIESWGSALAAAGLFTALYAVVIGITQTHPKAVLAYSSVSQMGVVVAVIGMGLAAADASASSAAAFYAAHHVLVKGALFLAVGVVAATGPRGVRGILLLCTVLAVGLGGLPFTGGALAKYAVKAPFGDGLAATLSTVSAIGTTVLMLHFVRRLAAFAAEDADATAPRGLALPWLVVSLAAIVVPWALYLSAPRGTLPDPIAPYNVWDALWPVLVGGVLAIGLARADARVPRIPEGDVAVVIDAAVRRAPWWGAACERGDGVLRQWSAAGLALLIVVAALGATLVSPR